MRQRGPHHDRKDANTPPQVISPRLQDLMLVNGVGTREALWAAQLLERKAAVAHWRSPAFGQRDRRSRQSTGKHRA